MKKTYLLPICAVLTLVIISCKKSSDAPVGPQIVKELTVALSASFENPAPAGRTESSTATLKIYDDNSMTVDATVNNLSATDNLTLSHIHTGDPVTNGPVILDFKPVFTGNILKATITGIRTTFIDSLKAGTADLYINVHSSQFPAGLLRGQIFNPVTFAASVALSGTNEVPAVTTTASGLSLLRLTTDNKLYSKLTVTGIEAGDAFAFAHIHSGATGTNGPVILDLAATAADFNITKILSPGATVITALKNDPVYVNVHSTNKPGGIIRGQIR
jgi:hypothetical protein